MASLKKNMIYSVALAFTAYLVPLLVFPYVSRILQPDNFGLVSFVDGTIDYFIFFSMLGMGVLGLREVAVNRNDSAALAKVFNSLFTLNTIATFIAVTALAVFYFISDELRAHPQLVGLGAVKLICNSLLIEWLYRGLEEFRYITLRAVCVRVLFLVGVFCLVKTSVDYVVYYALVVGAVVCNATVNFSRSRRFIRFSLRDIELKRYIRPFILIGAYTLFTATYTTFNTVYLGMATSEAQVAFYVIAVKVCGIFLSLYTAFNDVMVPRLCAKIADNDNTSFTIEIKTSLNILISFAVPIVMFSIMLAPEIVYVLCGSSYSEAVLPLRIASPAIFIIGLEQVLVYQCLLPLGKDTAMITNASIAAVMAIMLNIIFVPKYSSVASAFIWLSCEMLVLILSQSAVWKSNIRLPFRSVAVTIIKYIPLCGILWMVTNSELIPWHTMILAIIVTAIYMIAINYSVIRRLILQPSANIFLQNGN